MSQHTIIRPWSSNLDGSSEMLAQPRQSAYLCPMRITVMVPTWNEAENLPLLLPAIADALPEASILVVDDNSPDGTASLTESMRGQIPGGLEVLLRETDKGRGHAGRAGFLAALDTGAEVVVEMDADFSHHPRYLPALVQRTHECGLVLGSRYVPGGADPDRGRLRNLTSLAAAAYIRALLGVDLRDPTSGFRAWRRDTLAAIDIASVSAPGPEILAEMLYRAHLVGTVMGEVPIRFEDRVRGDSTLTPRILLDGLARVLRLRVEKQSLLRRLGRAPAHAPPGGQV